MKVKVEKVKEQKGRAKVTGKRVVGYRSERRNCSDRDGTEDRWSKYRYKGGGACRLEA